MATVSSMVISGKDATGLPCPPLRVQSAIVVGLFRAIGNDGAAAIEALFHRGANALHTGVGPAQIIDAAHCGDLHTVLVHEPDRCQLQAVARF